MSPDDYLRLADALLPGVLAAGRIEVGYYERGVPVERKADQTPVTVADREAEDVLLAALTAAAPDVPVIAEEASAAGRQPEVGGSFFLVDPLDGTSEFIARRGEFTINIGLIENGVPVFGVVYAPVLEAIYATLGPMHAVAAKLPVNSRATSFAELAVRRIEARKPDAAALVAVASRSHRTAATDEYLSRLCIADYRQAGSSLKFCLLAEGLADVYPRHGPTAEWDTAAGHAVLAAAGGQVLTLEGEPLRYGKRAAAFLNPHFVAWGRRVVEAA